MVECLAGHSRGILQGGPRDDCSVQSTLTRDLVQAENLTVFCSGVLAHFETPSGTSSLSRDSRGFRLQAAGFVCPVVMQLEQQGASRLALPLTTPLTTRTLCFLFCKTRWRLQAFRGVTCSQTPTHRPVLPWEHLPCSEMRKRKVGDLTKLTYLLMRNCLLF